MTPAPTPSWWSRRDVGVREAVAWTCAAAAVAVLALVTWAPLRETIATDVLHGWAWTGSVVWLALVAVPAPLRASGRGETRGRVAAQSAVLGSAVALGVFAEFAADLWTRDELRWSLAFCAAAVLLAVRWCVFDFFALRAARRELRRDPSAARIVALTQACLTAATGRPPAATPTRVPIPERALRAFALVRRAAAVIHGRRPGRLRGLAQALEESTDRSVRALRDGLRDRSALAEDSGAVAGAGAPALAEVRIEQLYREHGGVEPPPAGRWIARSAAVLETILVAEFAGSARAADVRAEVERAVLACLETINVRAAGGAQDPLLPLARRVLGGAPGRPWDLVDQWNASRGRRGGEISATERIVALSLAAALVRERFHDWAIDVVWSLAHDADLASGAALRMVEAEAHGRMLVNPGSLRERDYAMRFEESLQAAATSDHPLRRPQVMGVTVARRRHGTADVGGRRFGPVNLGAGLATSAFAAAVLLLPVLAFTVFGTGAGPRVRRLDDIHRDRDYAATPIVHAGAAPDASQVYLASDGGGLHVIDTSSLRIRTEDGPAPDGPGARRLGRVAVGADGSLAVVTEPDTGGAGTDSVRGPGIAARSAGGVWSTIIGTVRVPGLDMATVAHVTGTPQRIVLLLRSADPARRAATYDVPTRTLQICPPGPGSAPIPETVEAARAHAERDSVVLAADGALWTMEISPDGATYRLTRNALLPATVTDSSVAELLPVGRDETLVRTRDERVIRWSPAAGWRTEMDGASGLSLDRVLHASVGAAGDGVLWLVMSAPGPGAFDVRARVLGSPTGEVAGERRRWWISGSADAGQVPRLSASDPPPIAVNLPGGPALVAAGRGADRDGWIVWTFNPASPGEDWTLTRREIPLQAGTRIVHFDSAGGSVVAVLQNGPVRRVVRWQDAAALGDDVTMAEIVHMTCLVEAREVASVRDAAVVCCEPLDERTRIAVLADGRFVLADPLAGSVLALGEPGKEHALGRVSTSESAPGGRDPAPVMGIRSAVVFRRALWLVDGHRRLLTGALDTETLRRTGVVVCRVVSGGGGDAPDLAASPPVAMLQSGDAVVLVLENGTAWACVPENLSVAWTRVDGGGETGILDPSSATLALSGGDASPPVALTKNGGIVVLDPAWTVAESLAGLVLERILPTPARTLVLERSGALRTLEPRGREVGSSIILPAPPVAGLVTSVSALAGLGDGLLVGHSGGLAWFDLRALTTSPVVASDAGTRWRFLRWDKGNDDAGPLWAESICGGRRSFRRVAVPQKGGPAATSSVVAADPADLVCLAGEALVVHEAVTGRITMHTADGRIVGVREGSDPAVQFPPGAIRRAVAVGDRLDLVIDAFGRLAICDRAAGSVLAVVGSDAAFVDAATDGRSVVALDEHGVLWRVTPGPPHWSAAPAGVEGVAALACADGEIHAVTTTSALLRIGPASGHSARIRSGFGAATPASIGTPAAVLVDGRSILVAGAGGAVFKSSEAGVPAWGLAVPPTVALRRFHRAGSLLLAADERGRWWTVEGGVAHPTGVVPALASGPALAVANLPREGTMLLSSEANAPLTVRRGGGERILDAYGAEAGHEFPRIARLACAVAGPDPRVIVSDGEHVGAVSLRTRRTSALPVNGLLAATSLRPVGGAAVLTWRAADGEHVTVFGPHTSTDLPGRMLDVSIEGSRGLVLTEASEGARLVRIADGSTSVVAAWSAPPARGEMRPERIVVTADGSRIAAIDGSRVSVWDGATGGALAPAATVAGARSIHAAGGRILAFSGTDLVDLLPGGGAWSIPGIGGVRDDGTSVLAWRGRGTAVDALLLGPARERRWTRGGGATAVGAPRWVVSGDTGDLLFEVTAAGELLVYDAATGTWERRGDPANVDALTSFGGRVWAFRKDRAVTRVTAATGPRDGDATFHAVPVVTAKGLLSGLVVSDSGEYSLIERDLAVPGTPATTVARFAPSIEGLEAAVRAGSAGIARRRRLASPGDVIVVGNRVHVAVAAAARIERAGEVDGPVVHWHEAADGTMQLLCGSGRLWELRPGTGANRIEERARGVRSIEPLGADDVDLVLRSDDDATAGPRVLRRGSAPVLARDLFGACLAARADRAWKPFDDCIVGDVAGRLSTRAAELPDASWTDVPGFDAPSATVTSVRRAGAAVLIGTGETASRDTAVLWRLTRDMVRGGWRARKLGPDESTEGDATVPISTARPAAETFSEVLVSVAGALVVRTADGGTWSVAADGRTVVRFVGRTRSPLRVPLTSIDPSADVVPLASGESIDVRTGLLTGETPTGVGRLASGDLVVRRGAGAWRTVKDDRALAATERVVTGFELLPRSKVGGRFKQRTDGALEWAGCSGVLGEPRVAGSFDADTWRDAVPLPASRGAGCIALDPLGQLWEYAFPAFADRPTRRYVGTVSRAAAELELACRTGADGAPVVLVVAGTDTVARLGSAGLEWTSEAVPGGRDGSEGAGGVKLPSGAWLRWSRADTGGRLEFALTDAEGKSRARCRAYENGLEVALSAALRLAVGGDSKRPTIVSPLRLPDERAWCVDPDVIDGGNVPWLKGRWDRPAPAAAEADIFPVPGGALVRSAGAWVLRHDAAGGEVAFDVPFADGRFATDRIRGIAGVGTRVALLTTFHAALAVVDGAALTDAGPGPPALVAFPAGFAWPARGITEVADGAATTALVQDGNGAWWRFDGTAFARSDAGPSSFTVVSGDVWRWDPARPDVFEIATPSGWRATSLRRGAAGGYAWAHDVVAASGVRSWSTQPLRMGGTRWWAGDGGASGTWWTMDEPLDAGPPPAPDPAERWVDRGWYRIAAWGADGAVAGPFVVVAGDGEARLPWEVRAGRLAQDRVLDLIGRPDGTFVAVTGTGAVPLARPGAPRAASGLGAPLPDVPQRGADPAVRSAFGAFRWTADQDVTLHSGDTDIVLGVPGTAGFAFGPRSSLVALDLVTAGGRADLTFYDGSRRDADLLTIDVGAGLASLRKRGIVAGTVPKVELAIDDAWLPRLFAGGIAYDAAAGTYSPRRRLAALETRATRVPLLGRIVRGHVDPATTRAFDAGPRPIAGAPWWRFTTDPGGTAGVHVVRAEAGTAVFDHEDPEFVAADADGVSIVLRCADLPPGAGFGVARIEDATAGRPARTTAVGRGFKGMPADAAGTPDAVLVLTSDGRVSSCAPDERRVAVVAKDVTTRGLPPSPAAGWRLLRRLDADIRRRVGLEVHRRGAWDAVPFPGTDDSVFPAAKVVCVFAGKGDDLALVTDEGVAPAGSRISASGIALPPSVARFDFVDAVLDGAGRPRRPCVWRDAESLRIGTRGGTTWTFDGAAAGSFASETGTGTWRLRDPVRTVRPWTVTHEGPGEPLAMSVAVTRGADTDAGAGDAEQVPVPCRAGGLDLDRASALCVVAGAPSVVTAVGPVDPARGTLRLAWPRAAGLVPLGAASVLARDGDAAVYVAFGSDRGFRWDAGAATAEAADLRGVPGLGTVLARADRIQLSLRRIPAWLSGTPDDAVVGLRTPASGPPDVARDAAILRDGRLWIDRPVCVVAGSLATAPEEGAVFVATDAGLERVRWDEEGAVSSEYGASWAAISGAGSAPPADADEVAARLVRPRFRPFDGAWTPLRPPGVTGDFVVPADGASARNDVRIPESVLAERVLGARTTGPSGVVVQWGGVAAGGRFWIPTSAGVVWLCRGRRWEDREP